MSTPASSAIKFANCAAASDNAEAPFRYIISVRGLCELTAKTGDLDQRFTPSPTAIEGMVGHLIVTSRRHPDYQTEIALTGEFGNIFVRGRADGYDPDSNQLEEIKTYKGDLERMPENHRALHWAQVKIYGWLFCQERGLAEINLALVYYNVSTRNEIVLSEHYTAQDLQSYFNQQCGKLLQWAEQEVAHRQARNATLAAMQFPHAAFRTGQRELAEAVYKTARLNRCLMAQATTGIGKTLGTLFPLLKAMPAQKLDKLFFLTAKTSGRALGLEALRTLRVKNPTLPLRIVELVARDKACEHPDKACHGESCPLAKGFYDRLPQARQAALAYGMLDKEALKAIARTHEVCPYYLAQDLTSWSDVVVGDYNYYFDLYALLYAGTLLNDWRVSLLVDEAHNLVERGRAMYSAELDQAALTGLLELAPKSLRTPLNQLLTSWDMLNLAQAPAYEVHDAIPEAFAAALQRVVTRITDYLAEHPTTTEPRLLSFYFEALQFAALADSFGEHSLFDITKIPKLFAESEQHSVLCIRNVVPAAFLKHRFAAAQSAVLFSATLSPPHFYTDMLGLPARTPFLDVASPFAANQLNVQIANHISTRYRRRPLSIAPIVDLIARQYCAQPGNYLLFLSSFDYLQQVITLFRSSHPDIPVREQSRQMNEAERESFLARFTEHSTGIAFAVLGGAFGEGIDLPGDRLIGAFIATLGLPQINDVNEQMRLRMEAIFGSGYEYTYLYPGMQKVVQAAGRVIRTQQDKGVVYLIDDRFTQPEVQALLPKWWQLPGEQQKQEVQQARRTDET